MAGNDVVVRYNALIDRYNALIASLRAVHRMLRRGRVSRGIQMLEEELDGVLSDGASDSGDSDQSAADALAAGFPGSATLAEQQELVAVLTEEPTAAPATFSGRSYRLED